MSSIITLDVVKAALTLPRPGLPAQKKMAPRPRPGGFYPPEDVQPRSGGVLILLYPIPDIQSANAQPLLPAQPASLGVVLTLRTGNVEHHRGQVSFPGGALEAGETAITAALREAGEELGIAANSITILGELTPVYIAVSNYLILPVVGYRDRRPDFQPAPEEVAEVIEAPLELFVSGRAVVEEDWVISGYAMHVPFYRVNHHVVWGATAMILSELVEMLKRAMRVA